MYQPGAVVVCAGADSLSGDKLGCFNLSVLVRRGEWEGGGLAQGCWSCARRPGGARRAGSPSRRARAPT